MTFFKNFAVKAEWAALALALASTCSTGVLGKELPAAPIAPGAYIVEFADVPSADVSSFYSNLSDSSITATPRLTLNHQLFNGASFKLEAGEDNDTTVATIQSMAIVNKIWPVRLYKSPAGSVIDRIDEASLALRKRDVDTYPPHVMGGVDKVHAEGFTGEGIFVGIVDTGVDYNHPVLGGGFGPGYKVVTGTDLVGDAYNGTNTPVPDDDPMDCAGHGTHVSGIVGANPNSFGFVGVVPNATIGMWKVFGCTGDSGDDVLIAAFNLAFEAGVDLISASIGGGNGWTESPWDVAVQRITEQGVPCIIAAGNDGANGLFDTSGAGDAIGATAIGSIDSITTPTLQIQASSSVDGGNTTIFGYAQGAFADFGTISVPLYATSLDSSVADDACDPLPSNTPDLSSFVVLIRRGSCTFDTKIGNAAAFGADKVLFYNNAATLPISPGDTSTVIPVGMVSAAVGAEWVSQIQAGSNVTVDFVAIKDSQSIFFVSNNTLTGGYMSTFTSWGPSYEGYIKPQVSAPGGNILSTIPLAQGGYGVKSGTSMATPYISGVVALIKQIRGKTSLGPDALASLLASTANPVAFNDGETTYSELAPVVQQGGGLVNASAAAHTTTFLDLDNIALNDTANFNAAHVVTISNIGDAEQTYTFDNLLAATAFTLTGDITPDLFPPEISANASSGATISFEPSSLVVGPKSTGVVTLQFTPPAGLDETRIPVYSGFVQVNGSNGDALSLPYAGIASSLKDAQIIDTVDGYPYLAGSFTTDTPIAANTSTLFILPGNSTANDTLPTVVYALALGTSLLRIDVVPEDSSDLPSVLGVQILGSIPGYPSQYFPRLTTNTAPWNGVLADGSWAPAGNYTLVLRALKILGNETDPSDYERHDSPLFAIEYAS